MAVRVICPECGIKNSFTDGAAGEALRCSECGATLVDPAPGRAGAKTTETRRRTKRDARHGRTGAAAPVDQKLSAADKEEAIARGRRGAEFMLAAAILSLLGYGLALAQSRGLLVAGRARQVPPIFHFLSPLFLLAATLHWRPMAARLGRGQIVDAALALAILCPGLMAIGRAVGSALPQSAGALLGAVLVILLLAYLEKIFALADRDDLRDGAQLVMRASVGYVICLLAIELFFASPLPSFGRRTWILGVLATAYFAYWQAIYVRLLFWTRTTL
ncbi:MAG TPA: hypothetical protein VNC50_10125 [Planctomycetia bacterium]|nr:hypothetical protein [Planctomycetia bacterium]